MDNSGMQGCISDNLFVQKTGIMPGAVIIEIAPIAPVSTGINELALPERRTGGTKGEASPVLKT